MTPLRLLRTRKFLFTLPVFFLILTFSLGLFLVRFLEGVGMEALRDQSENVIETMAMGVENELHSSQTAVAAMAGSPWILPALLDPGPANLENANSVLDRYNSQLDFSVCYLLDLEGKAIASSNRNAPDSFIGKNYAFRSYFQEASRGRATLLLATGITSQERGFYAASPVRDAQGKVLGAVVIKKNVGAAESVLASYPNSFFISPEGVIFMSGSQGSVFKTLWPLDQEEIRAIQDSRQFKMTSFEPLLSQPVQDGTQVLFQGERCQSFRKPVGPEGWSLVILEPLRSVFRFSILGWIITVCMAGIIVILTLWALGRTREQELLMKSEEKYRGLFMNSRDAIMILDPAGGKFISGNPATMEMFRLRREEDFASLGPEDLSPERQPDGMLSAAQAKAMVETAVLYGYHFFEWTHKRFTGEAFPTTVLLTRLGQGRDRVIMATVRDITAQKQAEEEVKRRMAELERFNRIAVGRELKMIELKETLKGLEKSGGAA